MNFWENDPVVTPRRNASEEKMAAAVAMSPEDQRFGEDNPYNDVQLAQEIARTKDPNAIAVLLQEQAKRAQPKLIQASNATPWANDPATDVPTIPSKPIAALLKPAPTTLESVVKGGNNPMQGMAEAIGGMALALPVTAASGLAGLAGAALPGPPGQGASWVEKTQTALSPHPETKVGQFLVDVASWPMEKLAEFSKYLGNKTLDATGSPAAATAVETAIQAAPLALTKAPLGETAKAAAARETLKSQKSLVDAAANSAKEAGYVLPPTQVNPSYVNKAVEGMGGKIKTAQDMSLLNQDVTNNLVRQNFGIDPATPLTPEVLGNVRKAAGEKYEAVRTSGTVAAGPEYSAALDKIAEPYVKAAQDFPLAQREDVLQKVRGLRVQAFDAGSALDQIRMLRNDADIAYNGKDKVLGNVYRGLANTLEDELGRHLDRIGASPDVINDFKDARKTIAQTYAVEKHLSPTGNVNAVGMAKDFQKGVPFTGELENVARFGANFPKVARMPEKIGGVPMSPLDMATSLIARGMLSAGAGAAAYGTGHAALTPLALAPFARPLIRSGMATKAYQSAMVNPPSYRPSTAAILGEIQKDPFMATLETVLGSANNQDRNR